MRGRLKYPWNVVSGLVGSFLLVFGAVTLQSSSLRLVKIPLWGVATPQVVLDASLILAFSSAAFLLSIILTILRHAPPWGRVE